jgi:FkbM family methyltransferase
MANLFRTILSWPPIGRLPVRVRSGIAAGARWSLFPWTAYWRGTHEPAVQQIIARLFPDWTGRHVWDLGSHYGLYTVGLARRVGPTGSVAAFEPNPLSFTRLQLHVRRNRLTNTSLFPQAVSNVAGDARFFLYEGMETTTSHLAYENETWNESIPTMQVSTVTLDSLVETGRIRLPDFIKVDVEGHGAAALAGAAHSLAQARPILLIGFHSQVEVDGIMEILAPLKYRVTAVTTGEPAIPCAGSDYLFQPIA